MTNASDRSRKMKALFAGTNPADLAAISSAKPSRPARERVSSGAVKSMRGAFSAIEEENERLRQQLSQSVNVVELDPGQLVPSFVRDRFDDDEQEGFEAFVASIRDHGQQVPVLVRPVPDAPGRFQVAYGHRRWRACQRLGQPVRAIVQEMSDQALVVSQGKENSERKDLSFIEQALFARALKQRNYDRQTIAAALGREKDKDLAYVSILTAIAEALPERLVRRIGPAPRSGRPKWERLARHHAGGRLSSGRNSAVNGLISSQRWKEADSDSRLNMLLRLVEEGDQAPTGEDGGAPPPEGIKVRHSRKATTISIDHAKNPEFSHWLTGRLPDLLAQFQRSGKGR